MIVSFFKELVDFIMMRDFEFEFDVILSILSFEFSKQIKIWQAWFDVILYAFSS